MSAPVKLAGFSASTPIARRLITDRPSGMISMDKVPVYGVFVAEEVSLSFVGHRHIPQLRLEGRLERLVPASPEQMPYEIGEISLVPNEGVKVTADYWFNNEQIASLVNKGLYLEGFEPPAEWLGQPFEIDSQIDMKIVPPQREGEPPLLVADLGPLQVVDLSYEKSGYELADYFPDHRGALIEAGTITGREPLGAEQTSPQTDLAGFSFGEAGREEKLAGLGELTPERVIELMDTELRAPRVLRGLRADTRLLENRAERVRANLASPGLGDRYDAEVASRTSYEQPTEDAVDLNAAMEQTDLSGLENMDLGGLNLEGFDIDLGGGQPEQASPADEGTDLGAVRSREDDEEKFSATVIEDDYDFGGTERDLGEDANDPIVRARKARRAAEAARRATRAASQQASALHHEFEKHANTPKHSADGPELGG